MYSELFTRTYECMPAIHPLTVSGWWTIRPPYVFPLASMFARNLLLFFRVASGTRAYLKKSTQTFRIFHHSNGCINFEFQLQNSNSSIDTKAKRALNSLNFHSGTVQLYDLFILSSYKTNININYYIKPYIWVYRCIFNTPGLRDVIKLWRSHQIK